MTEDLAGSIAAAIESLAGERPTEGFLVVPVPAASGWQVGVDLDGRTVLLGPREDATWPAVLLSNLRFHPSMRVLAVAPDGSREELEVSTIIVDAAGTSAESILPAALAGLITAAGVSPAKGDIGRAVGALRDLFQALRREGKAAYLGVWGELLLMCLAVDGVALASAWGSDAAQVFDFAVSGSRLEAKTTQQAARRHHFSYAQLLAAETTNVVVASLQTLAVPDGWSARELLDEVLAGLAGQAQLAARVLERATGALGSSLADHDAPRYDRALAEETLILVSFEEVPCIKLEPGVVDVSWVAELPHEPGSPPPNELVTALLGS